MKPQTGTLVIPDENDKTTMPDDGLHAFICPHCGNNVFEGEDIISYDKYDGLKSYRCWGGFGYITYKWIPHKCTACNAKFIAWKATKRINGSVVGCYIGLILTIITMFVLTGFGISINKPLWLADIAGLMPLIVCIGNIEGQTFDVDNGIKDMIELAEFPNEEKRTKEQWNEEANLSLLNVLRTIRTQTKKIEKW